MKYYLILALSFFLIIGCVSDDDIYSSTTSSNPSGCPTTAACGCSNKNKNDCEADSCCKWTVGQGCGCS